MDLVEEMTSSERVREALQILQGIDSVAFSRSQVLLQFDSFEGLKDQARMLKRIIAEKWFTARATIGFYRDLKHYAESADIPPAKQDASAKAAGFAGADAYLGALWSPMPGAGGEESFDRQSCSAQRRP